MNGRVGLAVIRSISPWLNGSPSLSHYETFVVQSVNQLFEALSTVQLKGLVIEPEWFDDLKWLSATLDLAHRQQVPTWLVVGRGVPYVVPVGRWTSPEGKGEQICVMFNSRKARFEHLSCEMQMGERASQLLHVFLVGPGRAWRLEDINFEMQRRNVALFSHDTLKNTVKRLRTALDTDDHIVSIRGFGYMFNSCS